MKIRMNKYTFIEKPVKPGDEITVSEDVGKRLCSRGIAEQMFELEAQQEEAVDGEDEVQVFSEDPSYEALSTKELFNLCKEKGIELDKSEVNGKTAEEKRAYLVSKLEVGA